MQIQHLLTTLVVLPAACIAAALPAAGSRDLITPRSPIVGGKPQTPGSYPFVVAISRRTQEPGVDGFLCGGTLVSSNVVLTARHCFDGSLTARDLRVNAGSNVSPPKTLDSKSCYKTMILQLTFHPETRRRYTFPGTTH